MKQELEQHRPDVKTEENENEDNEEPHQSPEKALSKVQARVQDLRRELEEIKAKQEEWQRLKNERELKAAEHDSSLELLASEFKQNKSAIDKLLAQIRPYRAANRRLQPRLEQCQADQEQAQRAMLEATNEVNKLNERKRKLEEDTLVGEQEEALFKKFSDRGSRDLARKIGWKKDYGVKHGTAAGKAVRALAEGKVDEEYIEIMNSMVHGIHREVKPKKRARIVVKIESSDSSSSDDYPELESESESESEDPRADVVKSDPDVNHDTVTLDMVQQAMKQISDGRRRLQSFFSMMVGAERVKADNTS